MIKTIYKAVYRAIFGHEFYVYHIGQCPKVFPCNTWRDALEWAACALKGDTVKIVDNAGYFLASRK